MKLKYDKKNNLIKVLSCIALAILLFIFYKYDNQLLYKTDYIKYGKVDFTYLAKTSKFLTNTLKESQKNVEEKLNDSRSRQNEIVTSKNETFLEMLEIQKNISLTESAIEETAVQINEMDIKLQNSKNRLRVMEERLKTQEERSKKRLQTIYKNGTLKNIEVILKSKSILDAFSNYYMLQRISELDSKMFASLSQDRKQVKIITDEITKLDSEVKKRYLALNKYRENNQYYLILKNSKMSKLSEDEQKTIKEIEDLEKEKLSIEAEISRQLVNIPKIPKYVGGILGWPVPSVDTNYITARYKTRGNSWSSGFHSGVDIAIPHGTVGISQAVAAGDGRVIVAVGNQNGSKRSYGNYVVIDHGGDVYTLYGHADSILVSVGQYVKKGEPILFVGSTGNSSGPHLHFEVRKGGSGYSNTIDPLPYITSDKRPSDDETNNEQVAPEVNQSNGNNITL